VFSLGEAFRNANGKNTDTLQAKDKAWLIVDQRPVVILARLENQPDEIKLGQKYLAQDSEMKKLVVHGNALTIEDPSKVSPTVTY
jgi:hypothetical protein